MKRIVCEILVFAAISLAVVFVFGEIVGSVIQTTGNNVLNNADYKVNEAIMRSKQRIKTKHLVIGESVGNQLYGECVDSIVYSLTATVAITDVGEYLLLAKFLDVNKDQLPEDVTMIYNPFCWNSTLTGGLVYSTFVKNFYNSDYIPYMDEELVNHLDKFPLAWMCKYKSYQYSPYMPDVEHVTQEKGTGISPIQISYLEKIKKLCEDKSIKFRLTAGPIRESRKEEVKCIRETEVAFSTPIFIDYFESLTYLPDSYYTDENHLKKGFMPQDYFNLYE